MWRAGSRAKPNSIALKSNFKRFGEGTLMGNANRVLVYQHGNSTGVLVNGTTRRHTSLSEPGCTSAAAISASTIVFSCGTAAGSSYQLYDMANRQVRPLEINPSLSAGCAPVTAGCMEVTALGSDWVSLLPWCDQEHCGQVYSFQNLATGATAPDPTTPNTTIDLDASSSSRSVCSPVTVPANAQSGEDNLTTYGTVTPEGRFQIATSNAGSYLEQCGTHLRRRLTYTSYPGCAHQICSPPTNSRLVVWQSKPGRLAGVFFPSLKRFTIVIPASVDPNASSEQFVNGNQYALALTTHTLYLGVGNAVWTMGIPTSPPKVKPSHKRR
jgi:hypothetical protein